LRGGPPILYGLRMRRLATLLLSCALLLPGCGGGSDNVVAVIGGLLQAAGCTADGIGDFSALFDAVEAELQKNPVPTAIDINTAAVTALGTASAVEGNLDDGFQPGDVAHVVITSATFASGVSGSGDITADFVSATSIVITGGFSVDDGTCSVTFNNIGIDIDPTDENDYGTGSLDFFSEVGGDTLSGTITLNGGPTASVSASFNGGAPTTFDINLDTFQPTFN